MLKQFFLSSLSDFKVVSSSWLLQEQICEESGTTTFFEKHWLPAGWSDRHVALGYANSQQKWVLINRLPAWPQAGTAFRLKRSHQAELSVNSASLILPYEMQDFTRGLPSTGRHYTVRGEERPGPWAPLAVLLRGFSEVLPHHDLRVHHEGSMNFYKDK